MRVDLTQEALPHPVDRAETTDHKALDTDQPVETDPHPEDLPAAARLRAETLDMEPQPEFLPQADHPAVMAAQLLLQRLPQLAALATKDHQDQPDLRDLLATPERMVTTERMVTMERMLS